MMLDLVQSKRTKIRYYAYLDTSINFCSMEFFFCYFEGSRPVKLFCDRDIYITKQQKGHKHTLIIRVRIFFFSIANHFHRPNP